MRLALFLSPTPDETWALSQQIGVTHATAKMRGVEEFLPLLQLKNRFEDAGFKLMVYESGVAQERMDKIALNLPGRDEEIERFCQLLATLGAVGIPVLSWGWKVKMPAWIRTSTAIRDRGGSLVTGYDHAQMERAPRLNLDITEEQLWGNLEYFLHQVVPVAEKAKVKMALHPNDPPLSLWGIPRTMTSVEAFDRALALYPSDYHGVCFCQGCFSEMGADIPATIRHFGKKIHYAHFRDTRGTTEKFVETWHDEGPTDMLAAMRAYKEIGFEGPIRPDHVPTMVGEDNTKPGYHFMGRIFAVGYMKGLMEQL